MMRAMGMAVVLAALGSGSAYAQTSVAASATVVGRLEAEGAPFASRSGVSTIIIGASAARAVARGTLEYVQVSRVMEGGVVVADVVVADVDGVIDIEGDAALVLDNADDIRIVVTRVIASNS
jgi:hypothetical protein